MKRTREGKETAQDNHPGRRNCRGVSGWGVKKGSDARPCASKLRAPGGGGRGGGGEGGEESFIQNGYFGGRLVVPCVADLSNHHPR
jgi:hypothetical protein